MTNSIAEEFSKTRTLLISDIRSADYNLMSHEEVEIAIKRDMEWQLNWHFLMKPIAGMYKFRLPWNDLESTYLAGDIYFPVWGPQTTTESRLITTSFDLIKWNHKDYLEKMFYFNNVTRCNIYHHNVCSEGLDHCYDCSSEVTILKTYTKKYSSQLFNQTVDDKFYRGEIFSSHVAAMIEQVTVVCSNYMKDGRNLVSWNKKGKFSSKSFDTGRCKIKYHSEDEAMQLKRSIRPEDSTSTSTLLKFSWENRDIHREGWLSMPEIVMEDVSATSCQFGTFGGSNVPEFSATYTWIIGLLYELSAIYQSNNDSSSNHDNFIRFQGEFDEPAIHPSFVRSNENRILLFRSLTLSIDVNYGNSQMAVINLILLCSSGTAYFIHHFEGELKMSKFYLPANDAQHLTLLLGSVYQSTDEHAKVLVIEDILFLNGSCTNSNSVQEKRETLQNFLQNHFNFDEMSPRKEILNLSGFSCVK
jgi:hypothetical protein